MIGQFSISVSWVFPNSTQLGQVRRFVVTPKLVRKSSIRFFEVYNSIYVMVSINSGEGGMEKGKGTGGKEGKRREEGYMYVREGSNV